MQVSGDPAIWLKQLFIDAGCNYRLSSVLSTAGLVLIVIFLSWISNFIAKTIIFQVVTRIVRRTKSNWNDIFLEQRVFTRLSLLAPALVIWFLAGWALKAYPIWHLAVQKLTYVYIVIIGTVVAISFIEAWHKIYLTLPVSQHRHIKGYVQLVKLIVLVIALLTIISTVFGKNITSILAGLGAMAAVLMLIFKDPILGLVASIQLSANNMLKIGDWITLPSRGVDGEVEDITLTTVKVRNFDKTIITVPAYALVNESFQNWKGMQESGVRQIKRSIFIDIRSIKFPDAELNKKLSRISFLKDHIGNAGKKTGNQDKNNYTNLGLFRIYAEEYLKNHPMIDKNHTVILRHREIEGNGLPLQIYAFSINNSWVPYEKLQAEAFEHLLAILIQFDLRVFQNPTGDDFLRLTGTL